MEVMIMESVVKHRTHNGLVFDLAAHPLLSWVPVPYLVEVESTGRLGLTGQRVYTHNVMGYLPELSEELKKMIAMAEALSEAAIHEKLLKDQKKKRKLEDLLAEPVHKDARLRMLEKMRHEFLALALAENALLGTDIGRKVLAEEQRYRYPAENLVFSLKFRKEETGVYYTLKLSHPQTGKPQPLGDGNLRVLVNNPAWVVLSGVIYQFNEINGNMLVPFTTKDEIFIPKAKLKEYFEKFVLKVANKASIEADGFEMLKNSECTKTSISLVESSVAGPSGLSLLFQYGQESFHQKDKAKQKSRLLFEGDDVCVIQYVRDAKAEKSFEAYIHDLGFVWDGFYWKNPNLISEGELIGWLVANHEKLSGLGFCFSDVAYKGMPIQIAQSNFNLNLQKDSDWFDVYGEVQAGEFSFPFYKLFTYIREGNQLFPLPDGTFFFIPDEWMARFGTVVQFAKIYKENIRLTKGQFASLREYFPEEADMDFSDYDELIWPDTLKADLRPYQVEGVHWMLGLARKGLGGCLADDMGLGKTLQTIAMLAIMKEKLEPSQVEDSIPPADLFAPVVSNPKPVLRALVVVPSSLIFNWRDELSKFAPSFTVYVHTGALRHKNAKMLMGYDIVLTSYHIAHRDKDVLVESSFRYIILDESQYIKNKQSGTYEAVCSIPSEFRFSLTGTPIENSLSDLWAQMQFINPDLLGNFTSFKRDFIKPIEQTQDESKKELLRTMVRPYLLRRTKEMVASNLPPLTRQVVLTEMTDEQKKLYETEKSAVRNYILDNYAPGNPSFVSHVHTALLRLRQISNHPKLYDKDYKGDSGKFEVFCNYIKTLSSAHKVLVFSQFVEHLKLMREWMEEQGVSYSWLTGSSKPKEREKAVKDFQEKPEVSCFLISLKAGGVGLNLTAAEYVIVADPWWNPKAEEQAIARAHRIGQENQVMALKLITKGSVEERILKLQEKKQLIADDILDTKGNLNFDKDDLIFLTEEN